MTTADDPICECDKPRSQHWRAHLAVPRFTARRFDAEGIQTENAAAKKLCHHFEDDPCNCASVPHDPMCGNARCGKRKSEHRHRRICAAQSARGAGTVEFRPKLDLLWLEHALATCHPSEYEKLSEQVEEAKAQQASHNPRDWAEDFSHENGHYFNNCDLCSQKFMGHKRRVHCRLCATDLKRSIALLNAEHDVTKAKLVCVKGQRDEENRLRTGYENNIACGACAEGMICGSVMHAHEPLCIYSRFAVLEQQLQQAKAEEVVARIGWDAALNKASEYLEQRNALEQRWQGLKDVMDQTEAGAVAAKLTHERNGALDHLATAENVVEELEGRLSEIRSIAAAWEEDPYGIRAIIDRKRENKLG